MIAPTRRPAWLATNQSRSGTRDMTAVWRAAPPGSSGGLVGCGLLVCRGLSRSRPPTLPKDLEQADFRGRQALSGRGPLESAERIARVRFHGFEQLRVHIGFAADRRRVAERLGNGFDHGHDADPRILGFLQQLLESDRARAPCAEMLGGEVAAGGFANIVVDVARCDRLRLAVAI